MMLDLNQLSSTENFWLINSNRSRVKRFSKNNQNKDKFFDELRILASTNHIHAITKLRRTILLTIKPRTIEEVLLDHRQPLLEQIPWVEFSKVRPHLQYSKSEEFSDKELKNMITNIRITEKSLGNGVKTLQPSEQENKNIAIL